MPIGTTIVAVGEPDPVGGTAIDGLVSPINAATFTGTLVTQVISGDTSNPFGGLTFTYQIFNNPASPHAIERLTVNSFASFLTDASYQTPLVGNDIAPSLADRSAGVGDVVGFSFIAPIGPPVNFGNGVVVPGGSSAVLVVQTNATSYHHTTASVIDGSVAQVDTFAPVPEPATLALAGLGLVGLALLGWRRRTSG